MAAHVGRHGANMPEYIKALIFVVVVAIPAFMVGRRAVNGMIPEAEFSLWRNVWMATVVVVFTSGNFVLFSLFLALLAIVLHRDPTKPVYFYVMLLFAAPAIDITVSLPGLMNKILDFNPARILALVFLLPTAIALMRKDRPGPISTTDKLVILFVGLICVLAFRSGDVTVGIRTCVIHVLDIVLPYYVFSRALTSLDDVRKAMLALVVASLPLALAAVVEMGKTWRLYNSVIDQWGVHLIAPYLFRDGQLRAAVTAIEPIGLGVVFVAAGGCLLATMRHRLSSVVVLAALCIILAGLYASVSRGPWLGFAMVVLISITISRRGLVNLSVASVAGLVVISALMLTPAGERVYRLLPFVGSVDVETSDYRVMLMENSLIVIERYPLFGSDDYLAEPEMQKMIQGQGIIDIVNSYIALALGYGLVGLFLFAMIFGTIVFNLLRACFSEETPTLNINALLGTMVALLITIGTTSGVSVIPYIYWTLAGISVAVFRILRSEKREDWTAAAPSRMHILGQSV
ncbi:hypothetical protein ASG39_17055 [Rhizobium sp. Leaf371]|nr:hypothetical protein ASG39_17055 [Rhizobium sp. Leaf371]TCM49656.1 O-antigen ligase-like membrane protein [Rhizobium sp. PP-F2F-G48]